ncbi:tetratricopeptide repeat protein [Nocardia sp. NPDC020380]|uniref:serine/threonine-protein kinase n=1 Tax=Nocardia sp. NPDC020380 TaxID=3364309 RepID=UPI0037B607D9
MTCTEPGCTGTIEDGYCTVCGTAPAPAVATPTSSGSAATPAHGAPPTGGAATGGAATSAAGPGNTPSVCAEPGCGGTIEDGYCAVCGTAPATSSARATTEISGGTTSRPSSGSGAVSGRSVRSVRTGRSSSGATRGRLGAGMVNVPRVTPIDPSAAVMANPEVPEQQRYCGKCERPVGRSRAGQTGRADGFCAHCGTRFSFTPKLVRGDLVGGQYEVLGPVAHGGLGWIYLALDHRVNDRPVVLKGLLNTGDADAMRAAVAEKRFLAQVDHPNIVQIFNFVEDVGPDGAPVGYIVMAYVGGTSLKQLLRQHRDVEGQYLPPAQAIAYILEMLPALQYLHDRNLAYCDFKPDNVMQIEEQVKLIDLGAVISLEDRDSALYGTPGYQAPEVGATGPTIASEVYTVGRTLAVLIMKMPSVNGHFGPMPEPATEPLLQRHDSLYRFLLRATDADPNRRFGSVAEMIDQLTGVLREVLATEDGRPRPGLSTRFGPPRAVFGIDETLPDPLEIIGALPFPLVDPTDTGAALLASTSAVTPEDLERELAAGQRSVVTGEAESAEIPLRLIRAALEFGQAADALTRLREAEQTPLADDWRLTWYRGQAALLQRDWAAAQSEFDALYTALPGEPAPKLALAVTADYTAADAEAPDGARQDAARYYDMVWRTDRAFTSAAFGLARLRRQDDRRADAITVLDQVDPASVVHTAAGIAAIDTLLSVPVPGDLTETLLRESGTRVERLRLDSRRRAAQARMRVFEAALVWLRLGRIPADRAPLLGVTLDQRGIRTGLERCYRELAHETDDFWERIALVEQANDVRPRTTL